MDKIDIFNYFCKIFIINIYAYFICLKILNYKENSAIKTLGIIILSAFISLIYIAINRRINAIYTILIMYLVFSLIIKTLIKQKLNYCLFIVNISFTITYMIYLFSVLLTGIIVLGLIPNENYDSPINIIIITFIMLVIYIILKRVRRFKNGINFIKDAEEINRIGGIINITSIIILIILELLNLSKNLILNYSLAWITIITLAGFIYWLQSQITKHYKKNMRDRTISVQKAEIDEQTKLLEEVEAENLKLATAVHKYNHRLSSLELAMKSAISHNLNTEFADELSVMLKDTEDLSNSFAKECDVAKCILPLTNVSSIDNMFKYMQDEASKCNINFDLKINESINDLIDNIIPKDMFETLLGDHLRDAIIAVNASDNSYKSILTTLGLVDGCYELSVYDTGIEFQIDTLLKLGKEQVTTHKDSGGSGIGFMTTFETLKTTKASLVIEEYNPETTNYTKSVSIRFDGKNQYRIYSYRVDDIKKQNKEKRIIVKNIE